MLEFRGSVVTSDAGLLAYRELDDALGLTPAAGERLAGARTGENGRHALVGMFRQAVFGRLAGYEDVNDALRLRHDPAMRWIIGGKAAKGSGASPSQMGRFETTWLAKFENLATLTDLSGHWIDQVGEAPQRACARGKRRETCVLMTMRQGVCCQSGRMRALPRAKPAAGLGESPKKLPESSGGGSKRAVIWGIPFYQRGHSRMPLPETLNERDAVLFLGSGFSAAATNIENNPLPTGDKLTSKIAATLGKGTEGYSYQVLAETLASRSSKALYDILYNSFTVARLEAWQDAILEQPWRRIYTTNFDDAIELSLMNHNRSTASYTFNDKKPSKLGHGEVIHLHGAVRHMTEENCLKALVLGEHSYVKQHFEQSPWYSDFARDLAACSACFFVGYSANDYHISALLLESPSIVAKTYFVLRKDVDDITKERIAPYGTLLAIGADAFPDVLRNIPAPEIISDQHKLKAFQFLDPYSDKRTVAPPTTSEIFNLLTYGTFNFNRCMSTLPKALYVIPRERAVQRVLGSVTKGKHIVLHSRIGNGKSVFVSLLTKTLADSGYSCFQFKPKGEVRQEDIDVLKTIKNLIVIFDAYEDAVEALHNLSELLPRVQFIVTVRTGIQEVRQHEVIALFRPNTPDLISLNAIDDDDRREFSELLDKAGLPPKELDKTLQDCRDVRDVVLTLFRNRKVRDALDNALAPVLRDPDAKKAMVMSHLLKRIGEDDEAALLIHTISGLDMFAQIGKFKEVLGEIYTTDGNVATVRSSLFAEYLILNHFTTEDILNCTYDMIIGSIDRKHERRYLAIMSGLMRFSNLRFFLERRANYLEGIIGLYEKLKRDTKVNFEPLFWLQYSIALIENHQLALAESLLETAYLRAKSTNFLPYQIDTQALRLYLLLEAQNADNESRVIHYPVIMEKGELILGMLRDKSHRRHAVRVLENFAPFAEARAKSLTRDEKVAMISLLDRLMSSLDQTWLGLGDNTYTTDGMKAMTSLRSAKSIISTGL